MQIFESQANFVCPKCNLHVNVVVQIPEPDWSAAEDMSELTSEGPVWFLCPECKVEFEGHAFNSHGECSIRLHEFPDVEVNAEPAIFSPSEEEWFFEDVEEDPFSVFTSTYSETMKMLDEKAGFAGTELINRMIFSQQISALEAYLADKLILTVTNDQEVLVKLIENARELKKETVSLSTVLKNQDIVEDRVKKFLRSLIYHNLPKIDAIYRSAFGFGIFLSDAQKQILIKAIIYRHDSVHRNGRDVEGNQLEVFKPSFIKEVSRHAYELVEHVDRKVDMRKGLFLTDELDVLMPF